MHNINICHFSLRYNLRIIATVDEGHHLNVLARINTSCDSQPTACILVKEHARENVLINLLL